MHKTNVYNGEVLGFTAGKMFGNMLDVISISFDTQEAAESWCEDMSESDNTAVYVPIKLTSVINQHQKEKLYD